jgi:urea transport system substrate-binding protein
MKRWAIATVGLLVIGGLLVWGAQAAALRSQPVRIGLLHSKTGPMAISEKSLIDAEQLAIDEINANGGLFGHRVQEVIADGRSDPKVFAQEAIRLIERDKVSVIIGCWTSASRKSVKPVVERFNHLLIYPNAYEGLEHSSNIIYTGAAPNQHIVPAVKWAYDHLQARKYFVAGSDHIWSRGVGAVVNECVKALGVEVVGEEYLRLGARNVDPLIAKIKEAGPDVILSTVTGETNVPFYRKLAAVGLGPNNVPVLAFGIAEEELRTFPVQDMAGDYAAWNYVQSLAGRENAGFVEKFRAKFGADAVVSDAIAMAYNSVRLWAQAVNEGETADVATVRKLIVHQSLSAPEGVISIDPDTQHTWRPASIGRIRADGQFDLVWSTRTPVRPIPYPGRRTPEEWDQFVASLSERWGGNWANPASEDQP